METQPRPTSPARCAECQNPMDSPLACSNCGALGQLPPDSFDSFELFGLPRGYDVDLVALHRRYLALSRAIHPDLAPADAADQRRQALHLSAELNRAYDTLRDPVARAEYLLSLAGGPSASEMKTVPENLLGEILVLRETIEEARDAGNEHALATLREEIAAGRHRVLDRIAELARRLECWDAQTRRQLRQQLNVIRYYNSLLDHIPIPAPAAPAAQEPA